MITKDDIGVICQLQPNGSLECGDGVNWTGHYIYLTGVEYDFVKTFEKGFGGYVRHPEPEMTDKGFGAYYKNPWTGCISRDQMYGIIAGIITEKNYLAGLRLIIHHAFSLFLFSYNSIKNGAKPEDYKRKFPDLTGPEVWSCELRMFGGFSYLFYPILCVLDVMLILKTLWHNDRVDSHVISFLMYFFICTENVPTPLGYLAKKIIRRDRMITRLKRYWGDWRELPGMIPLYANRLR